ncbi:unnamed protein product [Plutella xylostella]|uniref:(diamondback moth) hypothetical protein n=1 Tax=Plutella xylostella TaxID=51655 RepID=A0A8S4ENJ8_PLUXY|nr:unnamed protein product [Plutella xylostella]
MVRDRILFKVVVVRMSVAVSRLNGAPQIFEAALLYNSGDQSVVTFAFSVSVLESLGASSTSPRPAAPGAAPLPAYE